MINTFSVFIMVDFWGESEKDIFLGYPKGSARTLKTKGYRDAIDKLFSAIRENELPYSK